jgi:hypothetical protein
LRGGSIEKSGFKGKVGLNRFYFSGLAPLDSAPVAHPVVVMDGANPVAVMVAGGLGGGGADKGQSKTGGNQFFHHGPEG